MARHTGARRRTLIVGGYGHVGRRIAERLVDGGISQCRLAGRDGAKAARAAQALACEGVALDLRDPATWDAALDGVDAVVVCTDQTDLGFVGEVVRRGLIYADVTADDGFLSRVETLDEAARASGAQLTLSVGLSPGLTNLLVKACAEALDEARRARICLMLGLGDSHGAAAVDWMVRQVRAMTPEELKTRAVSSPWSAKPWPAVAFPFADQFVVRRTLGLAEAETLLTFDMPWVSRLLFATLRRFGRGEALGRIAKAAVGRVSLGSDRAAVAAEVEGLKNGQAAVVRASLDGRREAEITALVAALVVETLLSTEAAPGVLHIEQRLSIADLAGRLRAEGVSLSLPTSA